MVPQRSPWQVRADAELLVGMPGPRRILVEMGLLLALVLGGNLGIRSVPLDVGLLVLEAVVAVVLLRPWSAAYRTTGLRVVAASVALLAVLAPVLAEGPGRVGAARRLGVELVPSSDDVGAPATEPPDASGSTAVSRVAAGTPADGVLRVGDRIEGIGGQRLTKDDPAADLTRRVQGDDLPEDTTVTVLRDGVVREVAVHLPRAASLARRLGVVSTLAKDHVVVATAVRDAVFIAFLLLLVRVDGQKLSSLGVVRAGALDELKWSFGATAGVFLVQIAGAIPLAAVGALAGLAQHEASQRMETLGRLTGQGTVPEFLVALVVAASFEEIAFRAFLTPRLRAISGSWVVSAVAVSVLFGLGHVYEGWLAILQTALLGLYFTAIFLARRRLLGVVVAHATFNAVMFFVVRLVGHTGALDHLKGLGTH